MLNPLVVHVAPVSTLLGVTRTNKTYNEHTTSEATIHTHIHTKAEKHKCVCTQKNTHNNTHTETHAHVRECIDTVISRLTHY